MLITILLQRRNHYELIMLQDGGKLSQKLAPSIQNAELKHTFPKLPKKAYSQNAAPTLPMPFIFSILLILSIPIFSILSILSVPSFTPHTLYSPILTELYIPILPILSIPPTFYTSILLVPTILSILPIL